MQKKNINNICFIDTEFNANDYFEQNGGMQEIVQIGAVVFKNGKMTDKFSRYCKLYEGHKLSKRCKKITGITQDIINKEGVDFNTAIEEFYDFVIRNDVDIIYAFGNADEHELRKTARLNETKSKIISMIKRIRNVYPVFSQTLDLHYTFSLKDICSICMVDHNAERAHSAINDAEDTALAFYNMKQKKINKQLLNDINTHKYNLKLYDNNRSINMLNIKRPDVVDEDFLNKLEKVFENAKGTVKPPILTALHDDMMRLAGRPDLELGHENI